MKTVRPAPQPQVLNRRLAALRERPYMVELQQPTLRAPAPAITAKRAPPLIASIHLPRHRRRHMPTLLRTRPLRGRRRLTPSELNAPRLPSHAESFLQQIRPQRLEPAPHHVEQIALRLCVAQQLADLLEQFSKLRIRRKIHAEPVDRKWFNRLSPAEIRSHRQLRWTGLLPDLSSLRLRTPDIGSDLRRRRQATDQVPHIGLRKARREQQFDLLVTLPSARREQLARGLPVETGTQRAQHRQLQVALATRANASGYSRHTRAAAMRRPADDLQNPSASVQYANKDEYPCATHNPRSSISAKCANRSESESFSRFTSADRPANS